MNKIQCALQHFVGDFARLLHAVHNFFYEKVWYTGVRRTVRGFFNVPHQYFETGPAVYRPYLAGVITKAAPSPQLFKDPECWSGRDLNLRPPEQQSGALPTELTDQRDNFYLWQIQIIHIFWDDTGDSARFQQALYCYGSSWQPMFTKMQQDMGVTFHPGIPTIPCEELFLPGQHPGLLVLDDVMRETVDSDQVMDLLSKKAHHLNLFEIVVTQNQVWNELQLSIQLF